MYAMINIYKWVKYLREYRSFIIETGKLININNAPPIYYT